MISWVKIDGKKENLGVFHGGEARSTCQTRIPWIKINKISQEPTNHKKIGDAIFGGDFRIGTKSNKIRLENEEGRLQIRDERGS